MCVNRGDWRGGFDYPMTTQIGLSVLTFLLASMPIPMEANATQIELPDPPDCNTWRIGDLPPDSQWVPSTHYVEIGQHEDGSRYILTQLIWDDVSGFGPGSTYESEVVLNNSDESTLGPGTYLDGSEDNDEMPVVIKAESNLPSWYLDTRMGDPGSPGDRIETAFTIGSGRAHDIQANTLYYTLVVARAGKADVDNGRFAGQLGCQMPPGCTSTGCSFSARSVDFVPAWDLDVPGSAGVDPVVPVPDPPTIDTGEIHAEIIEPESPPIGSDAGNEPAGQPAPPIVEDPEIVQPEQPQATLDLSVQRWCEEVYGPDAVANYLDYSDPYSWVCESNGDQGPVHMQDMAERQYGFGYCAYVVGPTAYDWKAGPCQ